MPALTVERIVAIIKNGRKFLITSHERPDGDAVGSELALYHILLGLGKEAHIYNQDSVPEIFRFLPGADKVSPDAGDVGGYDCVFVLDCSELDRIGRNADVLKPVKDVISIDHHVSNGHFSQLAILDPAASSTGELVYKLMRELKAELTAEIAINLYAAILTDTGSFHYANTGAESLSIAGELVRAGADPAAIARKIYESNPPAKVRLFKEAVQTLTFEWDGRVGSILVTQEMFRKAGASIEHTEGFVEYVRAIKGVEVAVFYMEMDAASFKVSMRSKGNINVDRIAGLFGGGGHANAAACMVSGDMETVRSRVMQAIRGG